MISSQAAAADSSGMQATSPFAPTWFALHTYPRHEKRVAAELKNHGVEVFLPLLSRRHQWSDRQKQVEVPLFPCYAFARVHASAEDRLKLLRVGGVLGLVGASGRGTPIPDQQIETVRTLVRHNVPLDSYMFLKVGQRVRIRGGSLDGVEGILIRRDGTRRLVISVEHLERSLSMNIEGLEVEPA